MNVAKLCVLFVASLITGCTLSQRDPTGFIPMQGAPGPGYTRLSDHFGIEVEGGTFNPRKIKFFHIDSERHAKKFIGANLFPVYESRQGAYALSKDGMVLLYIHDERLNENILKMTTGLYEYKHGVGGKQLDANARSGIHIAEKLPRDTIVFKRKNCPEEYCFNSPTIVRSTNGNEYIWKKTN